MISITISQNDSQQTLLNFCKKFFPTATLAQIYHLFYQKKIKINGQRTTNYKYRLQTGDLLQIYDKTLSQFLKVPIDIIAKPAIPLPILYQDHQLLIVIKEHGILTHSIDENSLDGAVRYYLNSKPKINQPISTFVISHQSRLDKMTKGLIIYPTTKAAQTALTNAQKEQQIVKRYYAIVHGKFTKTVTISGFIYHDELQKKMIFSTINTTRKSQTCATKFWPVISHHKLSLIECELITGRKHQIRATLAFLNHPVVGDFKYGANDGVKNKILLFAYYIGFKNLSQPLDYLNQKVFTIVKLRQILEKVLENEISKKMIK